MTFPSAEDAQRDVNSAQKMAVKSMKMAWLFSRMKSFLVTQAVLSVTLRTPEFARNVKKSSYYNQESARDVFPGAKNAQISFHATNAGLELGTMEESVKDVDQDARNAAATQLVLSVSEDSSKLVGSASITVT